MEIALKPRFSSGRGGGEGGGGATRNYHTISYLCENFTKFSQKLPQILATEIPCREISLHFQFLHQTRETIPFTMYNIHFRKVDTKLSQRNFAKCRLNVWKFLANTL
jgi:hypothetical protein